MKMLLYGKVLIVTGGGGAIGLAAANVAAREGARIMLVGRDADRFEAGRKTIEEHGGEVATFAADCSKWDQVTERGGETETQARILVSRIRSGPSSRPVHFPNHVHKSNG
jgi:short-subunit dehydrogenase